MKIWSAVSILALIIPTAAKADWQYTKWGMTPEQVIAASNGTAKPTAPATIPMYQPIGGPTQTEIAASGPSLRAPFTSGSREFDAEFAFKNGKLSEVTLSGVTGADCYSLEGDLEARYSVPFKTNPAGNIHEWHDQLNNNNIMFLITAAPRCFLTYQPLSTENSSKL